MPLSLPHLAGALRTSLLICGLAATARAGPAAQDPFAPGLRWTASADAVDPWIPRSLALAVDDNFVWCAASGARAHLALYALPLAGAVAPLFRDERVATAASTPVVAASRTGDALFSLAQYASPTPAQRRTEVVCSAVASGATRWTYDMGIVTNGPARLACDAEGELVVVALWVAATRQVVVDWIDARDGTRRARAVHAAANLSQIALSADGERTLVVAGLVARVLDNAGAVLHEEALAASTQALALSADGRVLALGGIGRLRVLAETPSGFVTTHEIRAANDELAARVALSDDGLRAAIGWWRYSSGVDLRFEVWDLALHERRFALTQSGAGALQNLPEAVRITPDGSRAALGCWGDGTSKPEVVVVDVPSGQIVLSVDLPGSVHALVLDASGTRVGVAAKHTHANVMSGTGELRVYDTGERDLVVRNQPLAGGTLEVSASHPGASTCLFLRGSPSAEAQTFPGVEGDLWLKRGRLMVVPARVDASGRADASLRVPAQASLVGTQWHLQAAFRVNGALVFGRSRVDPMIL